MRLKKAVGVTLALALAWPICAQQKMDEMWNGGERVKASDASVGRGKLFETGNYAMFIHWGLYSKLGNKWNGKTYYGIGEWLMNENMANADRDEYKAVARTFDPKDFDAMKIAKLAKDAGMKYIIITSKHHDGFAMYHSDCNKFNIVDATPFGRDPMKELSDACKKLGLGFGFYYSHNQDWTTPGASGAPRVDAEGNPKTFDDYFYAKCLPQVEEITRNYGDIELVWFDTPGEMPKKYAEKLVETVQRNQPQALVSGRVGYDLGDYRTLGDMEVPPENMDGLWESVDVTNDGWGYSWYDRNWKTPKQILENLISTIARGGTYMLNVGPDEMGNIPDFAQNALRASGKWIARYPQVIYGAGASPWKHRLPWGDVVRQGSTLYLAVYEWPSDGKLYLPGLKSEIVSAGICDGKKTHPVKFEKRGNWTVLDVPYKKPNNLVSVIALVTKGGEVGVDNTQAVDPESGIDELSVVFADANGCSVGKTSWMEKFGEWKHKYRTPDLNRGGKVTWTVDVLEPATYSVDLTLRGEERGVWKVETDEGHSAQNQQGVSSIFCKRPIGWISFDKPGRHTITVSMPEGGIPAELSAISLTPVCFE